MGRRVVDISGVRFGSLVAEKRVRRNGKWLWQTRCDCGEQRLNAASDLRDARIKSCGCQNRNRRYSGLAKEHPSEYLAWQNMNRRCSDPSHKDWKNYGGRGVTVCDRWAKDFGAFFADMGERPSPELSIDRKDNNGNYEPGNCRWATVTEQNRNRRPMKPRRKSEEATA